MLRILCSPTPAAFRDSRTVNWRMLHADAPLGQNNDRSKSISKRYTSNVGLPSSHGFAGRYEAEVSGSYLSQIDGPSCAIAAQVLTFHTSRPPALPTRSE